MTISTSPDSDVTSLTNAITRSEVFNLTYCYECSWCNSATITDNAGAWYYMHEIIYDPTRSDSYWIEVPYLRSNGDVASWTLNPSTNCEVNVHQLRNDGCTDPAT